MTRIKTKDSTEIFVKDWGRGRPVILIHGWPFTADTWDDVSCDLAEAGFRAISYDRRGFGRSGQPYDGYDYDTLADDLAAVVEATGAEDATLVGFSMGGGEVVRYLTRHGGKNVIKATLVACAVPCVLQKPDNPQGVPRAMFDDIKEAIRKDRPGFLAGFLRDVFYDVDVSPVSRETLDWSLGLAMQAGLRGTLACVDTFSGCDFRPELGAVDVPTLILHGDADKPVPVEITGRVAASMISQSELVEYEGATHGILVTHKRRIVHDLVDFLRR
jgi:non-heme chloroperoxidase